MEKMKVEICVEGLIDYCVGGVLSSRIEEIKCQLNLLYLINYELGKQVHKGVSERLEKTSIPEWKRMALRYNR